MPPKLSFRVQTPSATEQSHGVYRKSLRFRSNFSGYYTCKRLNPRPTLDSPSLATGYNRHLRNHTNLIDITDVVKRRRKVGSQK